MRIFYELVLSDFRKFYIRASKNFQKSPTIQNNSVPLSSVTMAVIVL